MWWGITPRIMLLWHITLYGRSDIKIGRLSKWAWPNHMSPLKQSASSGWWQKKKAGDFNEPLLAWRWKGHVKRKSLWGHGDRSSTAAGTWILPEGAWKWIHPRSLQGRAGLSQNLDFGRWDLKQRSNFHPRPTPHSRNLWDNKQMLVIAKLVAAGHTRIENSHKYYTIWRLSQSGILRIRTPFSELSLSLSLINT